MSDSDLDERIARSRAILKGLAPRPDTPVPITFTAEQVEEAMKDPAMDPRHRDMMRFLFDLVRCLQEEVKEEKEAAYQARWAATDPRHIQGSG